MFHTIVDWLIEQCRFPMPSKRKSIRKGLRRRLDVECLEVRTLLSHVLGTAENFAVLGGQSVTNTGPSVIQGNLGVSPGTSVTGFPPGLVSSGTIHVADAVALQAQADLTTAYNSVAGRAPTADLTSQDLGGMTLTAGTYFFSSSAQITGTLTLDAQGNPDSEFYFQIGTTLTTAASSSVVMINGGEPCDVYWQVGSSATLGTTTQFLGHILALQSISLTTGANINGSALARNGSVTLDTNNISVLDCLTGSISGAKFDDLNGDGVRQGGEPGFAGLVVFLDTNNNGTLDPGETNTTTDGAGNYLFDELHRGTYRVRQSLTPGIVQTTTTPADIILAPDQDLTGINFGDFRLVSISGAKFLDTDSDGVRDPGEVGLQGWVVFLDTDLDGVLDPGEVRTTTDAAGNFTFENVGPGTYRVREQQQLSFTQTSVNPADFTVTSGASVTGLLFGNFGSFTPISISGAKFQDTNGNGTRDGSEPGLAGWTVFLDANLNGVFNPGEVSTVTDASGNYNFANLSPGTYRVREVQMLGFTQTTVSPADIVAVSGGNVTGVLFGNFQLISVSGTKFRDLDGDGVRDAGEPGLPGVVLFLDANGDGILNGGETSITTDAAGNFSFPNLPPGTYRVREVLPSGFTQTTPNPIDIVASSGSSVAGLLFGNFSVRSIGGTKFEDTNGNGLRDPAEPGLQGFVLFLDANTNGLLDPGEVRATTDAFGNVSFDNLAAGTYRVREVGQPDFVQMTNNPPDIVITTAGGNLRAVAFGNILAVNLVTVSKLLLIGQNLANVLNGTFARQANFVANLYQTLLGRAPDLAGLKHYLGLLQAGFSPQQVTAFFMFDFGGQVLPAGNTPAAAADDLIGLAAPGPLVPVNTPSSSASSQERSGRRNNGRQARGGRVRQARERHIRSRRR